MVHTILVLGIINPLYLINIRALRYQNQAKVHHVGTGRSGNEQVSQFLKKMIGVVLPEIIIRFKVQLPCPS